jgi:UDP-N-acetyl-D-glucosamine dehydrogenase
VTLTPAPLPKWERGESWNLLINEKSHMTLTTTLLQKIDEKSATVGVVGLGYLGLPLILCFAEKGFRSIGLDIDAKKTDALMRGESYIKHIPASRIQTAVKGGHFTATTDFSKAAECDAILIAVPTPLNKNREPDVQYIVSSTEAIAPYIRKGQIIVLESSTYPGTTDEVMIPILERGGLKVDQDVFVAFSPEREDPGNPNYRTETIPKVVGATSPEGREVAEKLYQQVVVGTVPVSSTRAAEATKLLENTFRAVNIALVNELKMTFMKMGIDVWEVIEQPKQSRLAICRFIPARDSAAIVSRSTPSTSPGKPASMKPKRGSSSWQGKSIPRCPTSLCTE